MRRLSDFGESIFFIALGLIMIFAFRNPEPRSSKNTDKVEGILSDYPEDGVHDESNDYIGLWISGYESFYEFADCSYNDKIKNKVKILVPGDRVTLYVEKSIFYKSYPLKGRNYKSYKICDAYSEKNGKIISFDQYNHCKEFKANTFLPILGFIMIAMGLFQFFKRFTNPENIMDTKYLNIPTEIDGVRNKFKKMKPNKWSYLYRNSVLPVIMIISGMLIGRPFNPEEGNIIGNILLFIGVYGFLHIIMIHDKIYYIIDNEGVHIKNVSYFFQHEIEKILFREIREVIAEQGIFEFGSNIGTVQIHKGEYYDGDKVYSSLIGVNKYKELAELLKRQAGLES